MSQINEARAWDSTATDQRLKTNVQTKDGQFIDSKELPYTDFETQVLIVGTTDVSLPAFTVSDVREILIQNLNKEKIHIRKAGQPSTNTIEIPGFGNAMLNISGDISLVIYSEGAASSVKVTGFVK